MGECILTRRGGSGGGVYVDHLEVTTPPTTTQYYGRTSSINTSGMQVSAVYTDGSTADVTSYVTKNTYIANDPRIVERDARPYVKWDVPTKDGIKSLYAYYTIHIRSYLYGLQIYTNPTKTSYKVGEALDITDMVVKFRQNSSYYQLADTSYYNAEAQAAAGDNPSGYKVPYDGYILSIPNGTALTESDTTVTVYSCRYSSATGTGTSISSTSFKISVVPDIKSIEITTPPKLAFLTLDYVKEDSIMTGTTATITYADGTTEEVVWSNATTGKKATFAYISSPTLSGWGDDEYGDYSLTVTATCTADTSKSTLQKYTLRIRESFGKATYEQMTSMLEEAKAGTINIYDFWKVGGGRKVPIGTIAARGIVPSMSAVEDATSGDLTMTILDTKCTGFTYADTGEKPLFIVGTSVLLGEATAMTTSANLGKGWSNSAIKPWCNNEFKSALPTEFAALFKPFKWKLYETNKYPYLVENTDYFAVPPEMAVCGYAIYSSGEEGNLYTKWEYFSSHSRDLTHGIKTGTSTSTFSAASYWLSSLSYSTTGLTDYVYIHSNANVTTQNGTSGSTDTYIMLFGCI